MLIAANLFYNYTHTYTYTGKLLERLVHKKISTFLDEHKLLNEGQNGFRKGKSTIGTVAELTDDILLGINDKNYTLAAFIDLRKAFDTVSHEILCNKLFKFGFHMNIVNWLKKTTWLIENRDAK